MTWCRVGAINHTVSTTSTCYETIKLNNHIVTHTASLKKRHSQWLKLLQTHGCKYFQNNWKKRLFLYSIISALTFTIAIWVVKLKNCRFMTTERLKEWLLLGFKTLIIDFVVKRCTISAVISAIFVCYRYVLWSLLDLMLPSRIIWEYGSVLPLPASPDRDGKWIQHVLI